MDYTNVIQVGASILAVILVGFIVFKFKFMSFESIGTLNRFLMKTCYLSLVARNLAKRHFSELNFMPFVVGALTVIITHIFFLVVFLFPIKDKFKYYLSSVLPSAFVTYLIIGIPIFDAMWDASENVMVSMITLSNDIVVTPIYLVISSIYLSKHSQNKVSAKDVCKNIGMQLITSPIIIGNIIGILWSLTGWEIPIFFQGLLTLLGDVVLGICLLTIGGFIAQNSIMACSWVKFIFCIIMRHWGIPAITMFLCWALKLSPRLSRQCILMTVLPTGTPAFLFSSSTGIGPGVSSTLIFWSTVLSIPFIILWVLMLDGLNLFIE